MERGGVSEGARARAPTRSHSKTYLANKRLIHQVPLPYSDDITIPEMFHTVIYL